MANFDELKSKGNEYFNKGKYELAIEMYTKALQVTPSSHIAFSNRSLAFYKLENYDSALNDANSCVQTNEKWAKGHLRKATALNALGKYAQAKKACVTGFSLQDQCDTFVCEWLKASRALVSSRFDPLKKPPWSDVLPEAADLFCDEYCDLLFTIVHLRFSVADSMSHETMVKCVLGSVEIAEGILSEFHHPSTSSMWEWAKAATVRFESHPRSEWDMLKSDLQTKTTNVVLWYKFVVHKSLRQVLDPVLILALTAMLVRGNVLCQAYTGHYTTEYLGYACIGFFEQGVLTDPICACFHMAVLVMILNSYGLREIWNVPEKELVRGFCHNLEDLLDCFPKDHEDYDQIIQNHRCILKRFHLKLLKHEEQPDKGMDMAVKYIADIASKTEAVVFRWEGGGREVYVCGTFNKWEKTEIPLTNNGRYFMATANLPEGTHEYKFIVDGQWLHDPNRETIVNDFGTCNNVLTVRKKLLDPSHGNRSAEISSSDKLHWMATSLSEPMKTFNEASDKVDSVIEKMGVILFIWNKYFNWLKPREKAALSDRIALTPGVLHNFLSLADTLLPELYRRKQWSKCYGELNQCFALWSNTTPLMRQKLVEEGIVSRIMRELEVYKWSTVNETEWVIFNALLILFNCMQVPRCAQFYKNTDCIKLEYFTNSTFDFMRVLSVFVLSYMESKLTADQRHLLLKLQSQDVRFVVDTLSKTMSSPIPQLKALQNVVKAEKENAQTLVSQGIISIACLALTANDHDVQKEAILLLWVLACIPLCVEKFRANSDLICALQSLRDSGDSDVALASKCLLWDVTGGSKTDFEAYTTFAQGCYQFGMYVKCIDACTELQATCNSIQTTRLLKGKSLYHVYNKDLEELPMTLKVSPKDRSASKKLDACIEKAKEVVRLLGSAHDHGYIDKEGSKYLDLSMMFLISSKNCLGECKRCLLCLGSKILQRSHVVPKAILEAFASGMSKTSNQKVFVDPSSGEQKTPKQITWYILCKECEQLVGTDEEPFIRDFFKKIYDVNSPSKPLEAQEIVYGNWLYRFCISIFLRGFATLPWKEHYMYYNADKLYEVFKECREILKPTSPQHQQPSVYLFINSTSPTPEERQSFSTIHEVLVAPSLISLEIKDLKTCSPYEVCLFLAHLGILNIVVDIQSVMTSHDRNSINPVKGEYHVPPENERGQLVPQEIKAAFYSHAQQIEVHRATMSEKQRHEIETQKGLANSPPTNCKETFMLHHARESDGKVVCQHGVRPSQDPCNAKVINILPRGFGIVKRYGSVELPPGHHILFHCNVRDSDSSDEKGITVFLAIGDNSSDYPRSKPYAIYYQYEPGMYKSVGVFVSEDNLSVTELLPDDVPKYFAVAWWKHPDFQKSVQSTLMTALNLRGFSSFKIFLTHATDKRVHLKCQNSRRCWYCTDRCENCMEPAVFGLVEKVGDSVLLQFCSKDCKNYFRTNSKVLNLLPVTFKSSINERLNVVINLPTGHTTLQCTTTTDALCDREEALTVSRTIRICVGDGSVEFPKDKLYIIYERSTVLRHILAACFVSDDLSLSPFPVPPQDSDAEYMESFLSRLNSEKTVKSMLQAVLADAGFTCLTAWHQQTH